MQKWSLANFEVLDPKQDQVLVKGKRLTEKMYILDEDDAKLAIDLINTGMEDFINSRPLTYLAVPYSHEDPKVREQRFHKANAVTALLIKRGLIVFSPITHTHPIKMDTGDSQGWDYWEKYDRHFLEVSRCLLILTIEGWEQSVGVQGELRIAQELDIPVGFVDEKGTIRMAGDLDPLPVAPMIPSNIVIEVSNAPPKQS